MHLVDDKNLGEIGNKHIKTQIQINEEQKKKKKKRKKEIGKYTMKNSYCDG